MRMLPMTMLQMMMVVGVVLVHESVLGSDVAHMSM